MDPRGHFVWFGPNTAAHRRMNFNVQTFKGEPVLTWFQGVVVQGYGKGELVIADSSYKIKHVIKAHGTQLADFHDFVRDPAGHSADHDLPHARERRPARIPRPGQRLYRSPASLQEIDIATGQPAVGVGQLAPSTRTCRWPRPTSTSPSATAAMAPSLALQLLPHQLVLADVEAGNPASDLLISGRNTLAVYRVKRNDRAHRLAAERQEVRFQRWAPRSAFHWQHHVRA